MGKGKNKSFKIKEYKVPPEKYLVVIDPWGLPEKLDHNAKLNEIAVWFQLLLRKDYPDARVREIFYQKTHRNIIVELPREVDINKYLGAYHYSKFHKNLSPEDPRTVYLYEYRFATFGHPGNKNWTGIIPTNDHIPAGLLQVLNDPFPLPSPAPLPPSDASYARPIPEVIQNLLATLHLISNTSEDTPMEVAAPLAPPSPPPIAGSSKTCSSTQPSQAAKSFLTPYEPPSHYLAHVEGSKKASIDHELPQVKKMDPYEQEDVEKAFLQSLLPIKKDESNEAVNFLNSFLPNVKSEGTFPSPSREDPRRTASTFDDEGDYKPSAGLLDAFNTLDCDDAIVKSEVVETKMDYEEYHPSDELLAAFGDFENSTGCDSQKPQDPRVKEEPSEFQLPGRLSSSSERNNLPGSSISMMTMETPGPAPDMRYYSNAQIKSEPTDDSQVFSSNRHYHAPRDPRRPIGDGNSQSSRDPRKHPPHSTLPVKRESSLDAEDIRSVLFQKRFKMEN